MNRITRGTYRSVRLAVALSLALGVTAQSLLTVREAKAQFPMLHPCLVYCGIKTVEDCTGPDSSPDYCAGYFTGCMIGCMLPK